MNHHHSNHEHHMRKCAEFEVEENFASPFAAKVALEEVKEEQARVCEGHVGGNPGCPCLIFAEIHSALCYAALGNTDPWAAVQAKRLEHEMLMQLRRGRNLAARLHKSLYPETAAEIAGSCLGKAYKHYLR